MALQEDRDDALKGTQHDEQGEHKADAEDTPRFTPEEEATLLQESHTIKSEANSLFTSQDYHNALSRYDDALSSCPNYLDYERAVLQSNIAACHLKLEQWGDAIKAATKAIDGLAKIDKEAAGEDGSTKAGADGEATKSQEKAPSPESKSTKDDDEDIDEHIISPGATRSAPAPAPPAPSPPKDAPSTRQADILRIRAKALLRRARARSELAGWHNLAGAEEDYRVLSKMPGLGPADQRTVRSQLVTLPPRTKAAQEAEMGEMWGKLRNLGDGILKPFGLSTQNFQMVKDEKTGGYSMNFNQGGGSAE